MSIFSPFETVVIMALQKYCRTAKYVSKRAIPTSSVHAMLLKLVCQLAEMCSGRNDTKNGLARLSGWVVD